jgi:hypothetical protein
MSDRLDTRGGDLQPDSADAWPAYLRKLHWVELELTSGVQEVDCLVLFADVVGRRQEQSHPSGSSQSNPKVVDYRTIKSRVTHNGLDAIVTPYGYLKSDTSILR